MGSVVLYSPRLLMGTPAWCWMCLVGIVPGGSWTCLGQSAAEGYAFGQCAVSMGGALVRRTHVVMHVTCGHTSLC
jgi:hypothetical protein